MLKTYGVEYLKAERCFFESSTLKNKSANLSGHVIRGQRVIHQTVVAGLRKAS